MTKKTIIIQLDDTHWDDKTLRIIFETALDNKGAYAIAIIENSTILETAQHYQKIMEAFYALDHGLLFDMLELAEGYSEYEIRKLINALCGKEQYDPLWYIEKDEDDE